MKTPRIDAPLVVIPLVAIPQGSLRLHSRLPLLLLACTLALTPAARAQDLDTSTHTAANPQSAAREAANQALAAHDYAEALKLLTPLAAASPADAAILYDLASAQDALDQTSAAESSYRAAIAAAPALLEPHLALGLLYARNARMDEARKELVAATAAPAPDHSTELLKARALRALARLDQQSRPDDARDELLEAIKLSSETPEDTLLAAELAAKSAADPPGAEAALRRLLAKEKNDPEASAALARILLQQKRTAEAETLLTAALAGHPGDPVLTTQLAATYNAENKAAEALPLVVQLHTAQPGDANITHLLATLYAQTGDYSSAALLYAALSTQAPKDVTLLDARGDALIHLKRYAEAQQVLAQAVEQPTLFTSPADLGAAAGRLAFAASENNDPEACLRALQIRASVIPPSPTTLFLQAISEDKLHHVKLAREAYRSFLSASNGAFPDQEFEAQHRLIALEHSR